MKHTRISCWPISLLGNTFWFLIEEDKREWQKCRLSLVTCTKLKLKINWYFYCGSWENTLPLRPFRFAIPKKLNALLSFQSCDSGKYHEKKSSSTEKNENKWTKRKEKNSFLFRIVIQSSCEQNTSAISHYININKQIGSNITTIGRKSNANNSNDRLLPLWRMQMRKMCLEKQEKQIEGRKLNVN